jgi:hypothetical protein
LGSLISSGFGRPFKEKLVNTMTINTKKIDLPLNWGVVNLGFVVVVEETTASASRVLSVIVEEPTTTATN